MKLKFTIRHILLATVVFSFGATAMSAAYGGNVVATGIVVAPFVMVIPLAVLTVFYWSCYLVGRLLYPPIHTPAPASFLGRQSCSENGTENGTADMVEANAVLPVDEDTPSGAPK